MKNEEMTAFDGHLAIGMRQNEQKKHMKIDSFAKRLK
jgi:hypothetical protein